MSNKQKAEHDKLRDDLEVAVVALARKTSELEDAAFRIAQLETILAALDRGAPWRDVGVTFAQLLKASLDPARLVGLEVEIEGKTYLIGDVHAEGGQFGRLNLAFPHSAVVTRARVRVKR